MYQFYNNILTIPGRALYDGLNIMTKSNYDKHCRLNKFNRVRMGKGLNNTALIEFESIPEKFRTKIIKKIGYPSKPKVKNQIFNYYKDDYDAQEFFTNYLLDDYKSLSKEKQDEYSINAQMLNALDIYILEMITFRKSRGGKAMLTMVWQDAAKASEDVKNEIGHTLPKSIRRLKEKLDVYKVEGYKSLVSENFGNKKAAKIKDHKQEAVLRQLLRDHRNLDNEQIVTIYNSVAKIQDWAELSASTIGNYRTKWSLLTFAATNGEKRFDNKISMQVKRETPSLPLIYWTIDGWNAELLYQKTGNGLRGQSVTTYHNRLTMVVVLDPFIKYPVGYAIGTQENATLIKAALRNAVQHTEELFGEKHKVLQIQADNYAKKEMTSFYELVSEKFTPAKVGNAKSKVIEPWFKYFNKTYCQLSPNWSGQGIKSRTQPNDEYLNKIRHSFPSQNECEKQLIQMIEADRNKLREKYLEGYSRLPENAKRTFNKKEYLMHFGETTGFTNKVSHNGLHISINGRKREYDSFDINFRMHSHLDWIIKFDSNDLSEVLAYNEDQNLNFILLQKHIQPMALYDRKERDTEELNKINQFNRNTKNFILENQLKDYNTVNQLFISNPNLDNTLAKMLIMDSKGQHKNRLNEEKILNARKKLETQNKVIEKKKDKTWQNDQKDYWSNKVDINKYINEENE